MSEKSKSPDILETLRAMGRAPVESVEEKVAAYRKRKLQQAIEVLEALIAHPDTGEFDLIDMTAALQLVAAVLSQFSTNNMVNNKQAFILAAELSWMLSEAEIKRWRRDHGL